MDRLAETANPRQDGHHPDARIAGRPRAERLASRVKPWPSEANLYVLPVWVGPDELFVFVYPDGQRIHIDSLLYRT